MRYTKFNLSRLVFLASSGVILAGCISTANILAPTDNSEVTAPITFQVSFDGCARQNTFKAWIDQTEITGTFPASGNQRTAVDPAPNLAFGPHTFTTFADRALLSWGTLRCAFLIERDTVDFNLPVPTVPASDFELSISPLRVNVEWGAAASFMLNLSSLNNFSGTVSLSAVAIPNGLTPRFNPSSLTLSPGVAASSNLTLETTQGITELGDLNVIIRASEVAGNIAKSVTAGLSMTRVSGPFSMVNIISMNSACTNPVNNETIIASVLPNFGRFCVRFDKGQDAIACQDISAGYGMQPPCLTAVVIPPANNFPPSIVVDNLGFANPPANTNPMSLVGNIQNSIWQQIWYSGDQSLITVIQETGTTPTHVAVVYDVLTRNMRNNFFSPGVDTASGDLLISMVRLSLINNVVQINYLDASGRLMVLDVPVP